MMYPKPEAPLGGRPSYRCGASRCGGGAVGLASAIRLLALAGFLAASPVRADDSPASQEARRQAFDAKLNALTLHEADKIFDVRRVPAGETAWELPRGKEAALNFTYESGGKSYAAKDALDRTHTDALLIIKRGKVVTELYRNQTDEKTHFASYSMAKSITSLLIGLAIEDGHIRSIDDPIVRYVPELQGAGYDGVTIRQALAMRSGVDYEEQFNFGRSSLAETAFEVLDKNRLAAVATVVKRAHPPGEYFHYSTLDAVVLGRVLERATGETITDYMAKRLWKPAGMESYGFWTLDGPEPGGREFNSEGFNAVLRDYARIGLMMLRDGKAGSRQVVPRSWVRETTAARDTAPIVPGGVLGFQYQWWTIAGTNAYAAMGIQGQFIFVDPDTDTVIVKLSHIPPGDRDAISESVDFLRAASRWNGGH